MSKIFQNNLVVWQMHSTLDFSESGSIATRCAAEERDGGRISRAKVRDAAGTKARACPRARGSADRVLLTLRAAARGRPRSPAPAQHPGAQAVGGSALTCATLAAPSGGWKHGGCALTPGFSLRKCHISLPLTFFWPKQVIAPLDIKKGEKYTLFMAEGGIRRMFGE